MPGRNSLDVLPADARARLQKRAQPKWVAPMLATLTDEYFSRQGWLFEPKWERCLAFLSGRDLNLFSALRVRVCSIERSIIKTKINLDGTLHLSGHKVMAHEPGRRREAI
jgi:bifunctional non-homologous end joining protein LigD